MINKDNLLDIKKVWDAQQAKLIKVRASTPDTKKYMFCPHFHMTKVIITGWRKLDELGPVARFILDSDGLRVDAPINDLKYPKEFLEDVEAMKVILENWLQEEVR